MNPYQIRVHKVQGLMEEHGCSLLAVSPGADMLFLSGFFDQSLERLLLLVVPQKGDPFFIAPELYVDQIREKSPFHPACIWKDSEGPSQALERAVADHDQAGVRVFVDEGMRAGFLLMLEGALPRARFASASPIIRGLRMRKSPEEIRLLATAASIADHALDQISKQRFRGMTELALARVLEEAMVGRGAEQVAFETLVASGPNSALPHHRAGQRKVEAGDVVILDFGCRVGGYCSDITRTFVCGEPSAQVRKVYAAVAEAQDRAVQAVRPGVAAQEIDRIARATIAAAGYGEQFLHRTGHGIGLDVHEEPYIVTGNALGLDTGMTFSVEPGVYLAGQFGVRVEDIVEVTASGARRLNQCPRALKSVE